MSEPIGKGPARGGPLAGSGASTPVRPQRRRRARRQENPTFGAGDQFEPKEQPRPPIIDPKQTSVTARPPRRRRRAERHQEAPTFGAGQPLPQPPAPTVREPEMPSALPEPPEAELAADTQVDIPKPPARRRRRSARRTVAPQLDAPKAEAEPQPEPVAPKFSAAGEKLLKAISNQFVRARLVGTELVTYWRARAVPQDLGEIWKDYADLLERGTAYIDDMLSFKKLDYEEARDVADRLEMILKTTRFPGITGEESPIIHGLVLLVIADLQHEISKEGKVIVRDRELQGRAYQNLMAAEQQLKKVERDELGSSKKYYDHVVQRMDMDMKRTTPPDPQPAKLPEAPPRRSPKPSEPSMPSIDDAKLAGMKDLRGVVFEPIPEPKEPKRRIPFGYFNIMWPIVEDARSRVLKAHLEGTRLSEMGDIAQGALDVDVRSYFDYLENVQLYSSTVQMQRLERMVDFASVAIDRDPSSFENISALTPELFNQFISKALYAGLPLDIVLRAALPAYWVGREDTFARYHEALTHWPYADFADEARKKGEPDMATLYQTLAFVETLTEIIGFSDHEKRERHFAELTAHPFVEIKVGLGRVENHLLQDSFLRILDNLKYVVGQVETELSRINSHRTASQPEEGFDIERAGHIEVKAPSPRPPSENELSVVVDDGFAADVEAFNGDADEGSRTAEMSLTTIKKATAAAQTDGALSPAADTLNARIGRVFNNEMDANVGAVVIARALKDYWTERADLLTLDEDGAIARQYSAIFEKAATYPMSGDMSVKIMGDEIDEDDVADYAPSLAGRELSIVKTFHALLRSFLYSEVPGDHFRFVDGEPETAIAVLEQARGIAWHAMDLIRHLGLPPALLDFTTKIEERVGERLKRLAASGAADASVPAEPKHDAAATSFVPISEADPRHTYEAYGDMRFTYDHTDFPMPALEQLANGEVKENIYHRFLEAVISPEDSEAFFLLKPAGEDFASGIWAQQALITENSGALHNFDEAVKKKAKHLHAMSEVARIEKRDFQEMRELFGESGMKGMRLMRFLSMLGWTMWNDEREKFVTTRGREHLILDRWIREGYSPNEMLELELATEEGFDRSEVQRILKKSVEAARKVREGSGGTKGGSGPKGGGTGGPPPIPRDVDDAAVTGKWNPNTGKREFAPMGYAGMTSWRVSDWTTHCMASASLPLNPVFFNNAAMLSLGGMTLVR